MKSSIKLFLFTALLIAVNSLTYLVVSYNQKLGYYPPNADTIVIPIVNTLLLSLFAIPILVFLVIFPTSSSARYLVAKGETYRITIGIAAVSLYLICAITSLFGASFWFIPHHYLLSTTFLVAFVCLAASMSIDLRKLLL